MERDIIAYFRGSDIENIKSLVLSGVFLEKNNASVTSIGSILYEKLCFISFSVWLSKNPGVLKSIFTKAILPPRGTEGAGEKHVLTDDFIINFVRAFPLEAQRFFDYCIESDRLQVAARLSLENKCLQICGKIEKRPNLDDKSDIRIFIPNNI